MQGRGFTVVELIITITIVGILLTVAFVNLSASQVTGRDDERESDIATIATHLEAYYSEGSDADFSGTTLARYPYGYFIGSEASIRQLLPNIDTKSFIAPGAANLGASFLLATNADQTTGGVRPVPTTSTYVYQPLNTLNQLCLLDTDDCRKFNLYYMLESTGAIVKVTSRHQ